MSQAGWAVHAALTGYAVGFYKAEFTAVSGRRRRRHADCYPSPAGINRSGQTRRPACCLRQPQLLGHALSNRLISVVLPAYNAGAFIDAAIASILGQTYPHFELIVLNDGSTDDTLARIEAFAARDSRIRVISRENRGLIATLNEGIDLARGDLIARMDADDIAYPERFRRQVEAFAADPGLCLCGTAVDTLLKNRIYPGDMPSQLISRSAGVMSLFYTILLHPTLMIDRKLAGDDLHYEPSYPHAEDFDLIRRLARRHNVICLDEPLLAYRQHAGSVTRTHQHVMWHTHLRIARENLTLAGYGGDLAALTDFGAAITPVTADRIGAAMAAIRADFAHQPEALRPGLEAGWEILFFLIYSMLLDAGEARLMRDYLGATDGWSRIRRREQVLLRLTASVPGLAVAGVQLSYAMTKMVKRLTARHITVLRVQQAARPRG